MARLVSKCPVSSVSRCHTYLSAEALGCCESVARRSRLKRRDVILKKWMLDCADSEVESEHLAGIDWDNFGFGLRPTDAMFVMKCDRAGQWEKGELRPFGNLELSPAAAVLNYGQVSYEALCTRLGPKKISVTAHGIFFFLLVRIMRSYDL